MVMNKPMFDRVAIIGVGLIGSSLCRAMHRGGLAARITASARTEATREIVKRLALADEVFEHAADAVRDADLVILCTPVGTFATLADEIAPALKKGAILTDAGSVKTAVVRDISPHVPDSVHFIPGHPIAGTRILRPGSRFCRVVRRALVCLDPAGRRGRGGRRSA